jgi:hypothetical protein
MPAPIPAVPNAAALQVRLPDGREVPLHAERDPLGEARAQLAVVDAPGPYAVVLVGAGLGYVTEAARERWPNTILVVLEPLRELADAARARTPALYSAGRVHVLVGPDFEGSHALWKLFDAPDAPAPSSDAAPIVVHPVLAQAAPAPIAKALRVAQRAIEAARMNARAREENAGRYLCNTLRNVAHLALGSDPGRLRGQFANVPAIVVGAGPSLDAAMPTLRALGGRALLIATDTSWRPLVAAGIDPHLVIATDPTEANGRHLRGVAGPRATWVLAEGSVDPDALHSLRGRVGIFRIAGHHPWPWLNTFGLDRPVVKAWGSVLTSAYDVAVDAGCHPIVFVGSDLSFTDGRPYCRGTSMERDWARHAAKGASPRLVWTNTIEARPLRREPDVTGGETLTAPHLIEFRNWLVAEAGKQPAGRVVNASGAGILMGPGITQAALASTLADCAERDAELRQTLADLLAPQVDSTVTGRVAAALRGVEAQGGENRGVEPFVQEWLRFGRPRLTADQIRAAARAGRVSIETAGPAAAAAPRASQLRQPRWYPADRVALMRAQLVNDHTKLDGTVARVTGSAESRAQAAMEAAHAIDALLALPRLTTARGEQGTGGAGRHRIPLSARFEWVEAAMPLVAVLEESLVELGRCSHVDPIVPAIGDDFWSGPIVADETDSGTSPAARPGPIEAAARAAVLAERIAIDAAVEVDAATRRRQARFLGAILRGLADARLTTAPPKTIRLQPPASVHSLELPLRPEAVMRAITGALARPAAGHDSRLVLAADSVSHCEPLILTNPARSIGWSVLGLGDGCAVFTPRDSLRSVVVDAEGGLTRGPAWPTPVLAEAPWGEDGGAIAWTHPSTVLWRPRRDAPVVSEAVPFSPRQFSIGPDGSAYWLETSGALWEWLPGGTRRFVLFAPGAGYIRHEGRDVVLAPVKRNPQGGPMRWRADHEWRSDGSPHMRLETPAAAEGQCCKVAIGAWTARSYPFSDLVRLEHQDGRAWLLACYSASGVAWAGPSLAVTTLEGRLLLFPHLAERLGALESGPGLAQLETKPLV